jgi:hypothetical protein
VPEDATSSGTARRAPVDHNARCETDHKQRAPPEARRGYAVEYKYIPGVARPESPCARRSIGSGAYRLPAKPDTRALPLVDFLAEFCPDGPLVMRG